MRNLVLIGMRGAGKSTVGRIIAAKINYQFLDTDDLIWQATQMTIKNIIDNYGWDHFRKLESEVVEQVSMNKKTIISTGGGVVINPTNVENLKKNGKIIFLFANPETLANRSENSQSTDSRPALTDQPTLLKELETIWLEREHHYRQAADHIIDVNDLTPLEVAEKILEAY